MLVTVETIRFELNNQVELISCTRKRKSKSRGKEKTVSLEYEMINIFSVFVVAVVVVDFVEFVRVA